MPFKIQYRYRPAEYGDQLVRMYLLTNDKDSKLGTTPLPDGMVRVFRQNGRDGLSYLVGQPIKYVPIGDKIELNLGPDPNVIFELVKLRCRRDNIWMQLHGAEIFRKVGEAEAADRGEQLGGGLGRPYALQPAGPQLHGQADRPGSPPNLPRSRGLPQRTGGQEPRLPDGRVHRHA